MPIVPVLLVLGTLLGFSLGQLIADMQYGYTDPEKYAPPKTTPQTV